jgi:REP element-mobilizing transposase RayT
LELVRSAILHDAGKKHALHLGVIMPDHVHLLIQPLEKSLGIWFDLAEVMRSIKGVSARAVNRHCGLSGRVWQAESYDRIVRDEAEYGEKWNYILQNPVRAGLVDSPEQYALFVAGPR